MLISICRINSTSKTTSSVMMDAEDTRIAKAFEMKILQGYTVREIAAKLKISEPRVYQLIARAKAIGREYRKNNG